MSDMEIPSELFQEAAATRSVPSSDNFRGRNSDKERYPCMSSEPLNSISSLVLPTPRHPSGLPFYATSGARMGAYSSLRNVHPSRGWKGRSILCKTSWTRSGNEPAERSRLHDGAGQDCLSAVERTTLCSLRAYIAT